MFFQDYIKCKVDFLCFRFFVCQVLYRKKMWRYFVSCFTFLYMLGIGFTIIIVYRRCLFCKGCPYFRSGLTQPGMGTRSCINNIHNLEFWHLPLYVIRSVSDVLRAQSRFVKFVGGEACGLTPYTFYKPTLGPKYVSNRPYNEFITPTTLI